MRNDSKRTSKKLSIKRETLRKLQLRTVSDDDLRRAGGGLSATCTDNNCHAPSHNGC